MSQVEALTAQLCSRVAELTRRPVESIDTAASLASLGLESIMIIDLQALLEEQWSLADFPIAPTVTIDEIAGRADRLRAGDGSEPHPVPATEQVAVAALTFPAVPLQRAYLVGRRRDLPLGEVAAHMYLEYDSDGLDLARAEAALQRLIERHAMLRTVLHPNGMLETLTSLPPYTIAVTDLREANPAGQKTRLAQMREQGAHRLRPPQEWPLFEVAAARLGEQRSRIFISLDFIVADAASCLRLLTEWGLLYRDLDTELPPLPTTFADWSHTEAEVDPDRLARARDYWAGRAERLPPAPELPLLANPQDVVGAHFRRRQVLIDAGTWSALRERAGERGLTTSVLLCAAFARVLAEHARRPDFTLTLTMFNRPAVAGIEHVVGDFSSTALLAVDAQRRRSFESLARGMQDRLWLDLQHRGMPGMAVLREMWRARGGPAPLMPVVFTSLFEDFSGLQWLGDNVYGVSETPQVYLDHQTFERAGDLVLQFDYVPALVGAELLDQMLERHLQLLTALAGDQTAWESTDERTAV